MDELRGCARLALKSADVARLFQHMRDEDLDGAAPPDGRLLTDEHSSIAAAPDHSLEQKPPGDRRALKLIEIAKRDFDGIHHPCSAVLHEMPVL